MVDVLMASRSSPAYVFVLKLVANKEINETKSIRAVELLQPFEPTHELIDEVFVIIIFYIYYFNICLVEQRNISMLHTSQLKFEYYVPEIHHIDWEVFHTIQSTKTETETGSVI